LTRGTTENATTTKIGSDYASKRLASLVIASPVFPQCVSSCASERWDIKTRCDTDAGAINFDPGYSLDTTTEQMAVRGVRC
jgi:hypothetical protein